MKKNSIYILLTLLTTLAGCAKMTYDQDQNDRSEPDASDAPVWTLTVEAAKGIPGQAGDDSWGVAGDDSWGVAEEGTKALELVNEGVTLNAYWVQDEKVGVYVNGAYAGQLLATPMTDAKKATLSGTITAELQVNDAILLLYPDREDITEGSKWDYTGQNGATPTPAGDLSTKYDYATATLTVTGVNGNEVTTTRVATFQNEQSIYRLDFKVNSSLRSVNWFSVSSNRNKLVTSRSYSEGWTSAYGGVSVSLASAASSPYLSLRNENTTEADTYTFFVRDGNNDLFTGTKEIPAAKLGNGKFLAPSVDLSAYSVTTQASGNIINPQDIF